MKKILILSANPINTNKLRLSEEIREIRVALERAQNRKAFELITREAVRIDDLRRALLENNPEIVHFSGHGTGTDGLALENDFGTAQIVSTESLSNLLKSFKKIINCVLLNACYSETQAEAIYQHINCVIGMKTPIHDNAAINFSKGFYDAIFAGRSYADAFELGRNNIELNNILESNVPIIKLRRDFKKIFESTLSSPDDPLHPDSESKSPFTPPLIQQRVDSAELGGGMQGTQGNRNTQIQGNRNFILSFHIHERVYRRWLLLLLVPLLVGFPALGFTLPKLRERLKIALFDKELFRPFVNLLPYKDSIHNFVVQYPNNWVYEKDDNPITHEVVSFMPASEAEAIRSPQLEVIITCENLSEPITLSNYIDQFINQLKKTKNFQAFKLLKQGATTFAKRPAYGLIYTVTSEGRNWEIMEVATIKNLQVYLITYKAEVSQYDTYGAIAHTMIHSFEIFGQD